MCISIQNQWNILQSGFGQTLPFDRGKDIFALVLVTLSHDHSSVKPLIDTWFLVGAFMLLFHRKRYLVTGRSEISPGYIRFRNDALTDKKRHSCLFIYRHFGSHER